MKTTILFAAAILVMPSVLPAQSRGRPARAAARAATRSAAPVVHKAAAPRVYTSQASRIAATGVSPGTAARAVAVSLSGSGQALPSRVAGGKDSFSGGRRARGSWSGGFDRLGFQKKTTLTFTARRADAPAETSVPAEAPPPYTYTPGALIRSEGLGYAAAPANDARWQTTAPGYAIVQDLNQSVLLNPFPGIRVGPADKLPPPTPGRLGSASGRNAITANNVPLPEAYSSDGSSDHNRDEGGKPDNPKDKDK